MSRSLPAILLLTALSFGALPAMGQSDPFPEPPEIADQVRFWTRVYSEVGTDGGLIHDARDLGIVYGKIHFREGTSRRARQRQIDRAKDRYQAILRRLAGGKRSGLDAEEKRVLALFPEGVGKATLRAARKRIRFQLGQADRFRAGIIRSGRWEPHIMKVLADHGVPYELAALPHVESSYNPDAHSHAGAAGLWQFTRSTGRLFMRIDYVVDERRDPYVSSVAAARLLLANYRRTGSWPTAITAYNHGTAGMERAIRKLGTRDIGTIVRRYKSRTFGFASRNFYTSFLAAVEVSHNYEHYFGELVIDPPEDLVAVPLDHYYAPATLSRIFGVGERTLRAYNQSLLSPVWDGQKYVPKGHVLRFPRNPDMSAPQELLAQVPASERILRQRPDRAYRVRRGDTLSGIARRFGVRTSELVALNGLRSKHRIRIGQRLKLPTHEAPTTVAMVRDHDRNARPKLERPADGRYTVHRGDTLSGIASTFGLSLEELTAANRLRDKNRLTVGQSLLIPGGVGEAGGTYVVQRGDTLERIARRHGVSLRALEDRNHVHNRNRIRVGQLLTIPGPAHRPGPAAPPTRYVVRRGDTLARIAARHGTTPRAIQAASRLRDRNRIGVGEVLTIPGRGAPAAAAPGPAEVVAAQRPPVAPTALAPEPRAAQPSPGAATGSEAASAATEPAGRAAEPRIATATKTADEPGRRAEESARIAQVLASETPAAAAPPPGTAAGASRVASERAPTAPQGGAASKLPWAPRRYKVAADGSIVVRPEETLGHYADWLSIRTQRLRDLNGLRYGKSLAIGKRVRLDFSQVDRATFERRRIAHHRSLQTAFFDAYAVAGTEQHVLRRGETLWKISKGKYDVPVWLIQQYNPSLDVNALRPGTRILIPKLQPRRKSPA